MTSSSNDDKTELETNGLCLGIDPGSPGGFAFVDIDKPKEVYGHFPHEGDWERTFQTLFYFVPKVVYVALEDVNPFGMGRKSAFTFGLNVGTWWGILMSFGLTPNTVRVRPEHWQNMFLVEHFLDKEYIVPKEEKEKRKRRSRRKQQLKKMSVSAAMKFFNIEKLRQKDNDQADALWLAMFARFAYRSSMDEQISEDTHPNKH